MKYGEAFSRLGYSLASVRQDWSAETPSGICLSLWKQEMGHLDRLPYIDLWELHPNGGAFVHKSGHSKRTQHIATALEVFGGRVDAVLVSGVPGERYVDADPWITTKRGGYWLITKFDPDDGFFRVEAVRSKET